MGHAFPVRASAADSHGKETRRNTQRPMPNSSFIIPMNSPPIRSPRRAAARLLVCLAVLTALAVPPLPGAAAPGGPPTDPILRLENGRHTAQIRRIASDARGRWIASASDDKTLRLWDAGGGALLRTFRLPIGDGDEGKLYAVAMDPQGDWIAAGGWTDVWGGNTAAIYLLDRGSGRLLQRLDGLPNVIYRLCASPDGRWLGAMLGGANGARVFDAKAGFREAFADRAYGDDSYGCAFSPDGRRLVTTSFDGKLRLYRRQDGAFQRIKEARPDGGKRPFAIAFHPHSNGGGRIAVGFHDTTAVQVLDGNDLSPRYTPDTSGIGNGSLSSVAWSAEGGTLFAGGRYEDDTGNSPVLAWRDGGRGARTSWRAADNTVMDLAPLPGGGLAAGTTDPALVIFDARGKKSVDIRPRIADLRNKLGGRFRLSADGGQLAFGLGYGGKEPVRFDLAGRRLLRGLGNNQLNIVAQIQQRLAALGYDPGAMDGEWGPRTRAAAAEFRRDNGLGEPNRLELDHPELDHALQQALGIAPLAAPRTEAPGLAIRDWEDEYNPTLNGEPLELRPYERSRSLAIAPDGERFLLGTSWYLRLFDGAGRELWQRAVPGVAWGVNISGDGRLAVAAFGDGTIRWYRLKDGAPLLSLFVTRDGKDWVAWTPSGYYDASPGGDRLIGLHVNNGKDALADFYPASELRGRFYRPEVVALVLTELDEGIAIHRALAKTGQ